MNKKILALLVIFLAATLSPLLIAGPIKTSALSGSQFQPGHIIDDSVFYDYRSMSAGDIQAFLNSQVPTCDTSGTQSISYYYNSTTGQVGSGSYVTTSRATYGQRYATWYNAHPYTGYINNESVAPYTCLKSYSQSTPAVNASSGICGYLTAQSSENAANIIAQVAAACGINPKVLIVLIEKEQGLVTDDWPWTNEYQQATGYACPDSTGCSSTYYGFFNQVYHAAWQFKEYQANNGSPGAYWVGSYKIQYSPTAACGTETVNIQNGATASLYDYTPYVPNQAALNNLYGTGDSCSSYGNRNFWRYYNDWFGSPYATPFFRINNGTAIYILGSDNNYYWIPNNTVLGDYGYGHSFNYIENVPSSYINGLTFSGALPLVTKFDGNNPVYLIDDGNTHWFTSQTVGGNTVTGATIYAAYGSPSYADLPGWVYNSLTHSTNMAQVVRQTTAPEIYYVQNSKKDHIINATAWNTLGSPAYSSQPSVTLTTAYVQSLADGPPIMPEGTVTKTSDANSYGVWDGSALQPFNASAASDLGIINYSAPASVINQLPAGATTLNKLAKDSSGNTYILDGGKKLSITSGQMTDLGLTGSDFVAADDVFLSNIPTQNLPSPSLIRVNGTAPIYLIKNGSTYHVYSYMDFVSSGFNMNDVMNVIPDTFNLFVNTGEELFAPGALIRINNTAPVYLVDYSVAGSFSMYRIPSREVFNNYGFSLNSVENYASPNGAINGYPNVGNLPQVVKDASSNYWLVDSGARHEFNPTTLLDASAYNIDQVNAYMLTDSVLSKIGLGGNLTDEIQPSGSPKVYKIANGEKSWYTSRSAFENNGGNWGAITQVSASYAASIPEGPDIN